MEFEGKTVEEAGKELAKIAFNNYKALRELEKGKYKHLADGTVWRIKFYKYVAEVAEEQYNKMVKQYKEKEAFMKSLEDDDEPVEKEEPAETAHYQLAYGSD